MHEYRLHPICSWGVVDWVPGHKHTLWCRRLTLPFTWRKFALEGIPIPLQNQPPNFGNGSFIT
jgi:hypothetical protein